VLNGGAGGSAGVDGQNATGPGGGGGGGADDRIGGNGDFGGGGGGSGENDLGTDHPAGSSGYGGGGGGGGEDDSGGRGGFGGGGGGGNEDGLGGPALSAAGGFGAGNGGNFGGALVGSAGGGGGAGMGGAIFNHNGTLTLTNTTVTGNGTQGGSGGGGAFTGGSGEALGGGIFNLNGDLLLQNATFANNNAGRGADVFNLAHETTGGVTPAAADLELDNSILGSTAVANVENAQVGADPGNAVVNGDAADILRAAVVNTGGTVNDGGMLVVNPLLGGLFDNGGPTLTHAPQFPGSPAIDAGAAGAATDQRGVTRPQGPGFDIGAVEVPRFTGALVPGDLLLSEYSFASVVDIQGGGDFALAPRFAYGLEGPFGLCEGPGSEVYVAEFAAGEVTIITAGGDFGGAAAFATGLTSPVNLVCSDTQILVAEFAAGEVTDITAGGDFTGATPFAFGLGASQLVGLFRDSNGKLWASNQAGRVHDITLGGDFSADPGFANMGGDLRGVTQRGSALLASSTNAGNVRDFTAGGDLTAAPVFATVPMPTEIQDFGPVGLFAPSQGGDVYEISAGGDFTAAEPFATGVGVSGGFADLALVSGCGDGIVDPETEECDDGNVVGADGCSETCAVRCAPAPEAGCVEAASASLKLDERKAGKEKLSASLKKLGDVVAQADFGDPVGGDTRLALCVYDASDALVLDLRVDRAGELCGTQQKPCWKAIKMQGYGYKDPSAEGEGATKVVAKGGAAGKGAVSLQGRNNQSKGQTDLPTGAAADLAGETSATLQMLVSDGACFSAELTSVQKAEGGQFKAKTP
jgi:cysteine-rich repeat protein